MKKAWLTLIVAASLSVLTPGVRADVAAATKYLNEATELVGKGSQFFGDAAAKLELAEASMDDVPAAEKPALKTKLDALKTQIATATQSDDQKRIDARVKDQVEQLEGVVGNLVAWPGKATELTELLNDPKTTAALGEPAVTAYKKQFETMTKVHSTRALKENLGVAKEQVDALDKFWTEKKAIVNASSASADDRSNALHTTKVELDAIGRYFKDLPADNADVKALADRVTKVRTEHASASGNAGATAMVDRINTYLEDNKDAFAGMDAETTPPTWADYKSSTGTAREFNAPKTLEYVRRVSYWLPTFEQNEEYQAAKDTPAVKAKMDEVKAKLAASREKIKKHAEALVTGLEAEKVNKDNMGDSMGLSSQIRQALGETSDEAKTLMARCDKAQADFKQAGDKAEAETMAYYKSMTEQADKAWPGMVGKFDVAGDFDPNNAAAAKGKYVKIVGHNLMGWRFKHGDFPYATKINGVPVAGKYDPAVKGALAEVEAKLGRAIGDNDADGAWTAIALVDGGSGRLVELVKRSGDVKVDGASVGTVEATDETSVEAPIVTIVALKAGPVAVAQGQGAVKADGSISAPVAVAGGASAGRGGLNVIGIVTGLLGLCVGAACLMKAKFAPLAGNAGAMQLTEKVGSQNLAFLGLAGVALGVVGLLMNLIALPSAFLSAVIGLVASLAMIVAGGVVSRDLLESRGLLPANLAAPLGQFAVPAGLACAALGALTLVLSVF